MATDSQSADKARRYLRTALSLNPMWESDQLLTLRRQALGLKKVIRTDDGPSVSDMQERRDVMRRLVQRIQHEFWSLPLDQLQRKIQAIDTKHVPELSGVVQRLRTTAICRGEFRKLSSASAMDQGLFRAFKAAVVLPPSEAGYVREQFLQGIEDRRQLNAVKKSIRLIKKEYPLLYALEKDWFKTINGLKKPRPAKAQETEYRNDFDSDEGGLLSNWGVWFVAFLIIRVLLAALNN